MANAPGGKTSRATDGPERHHGGDDEAPLEVLAVTPDRWSDLERLFGKTSIVEAYPQKRDAAGSADAAVYLGTTSLFTRAGFREVARRSAKRPILRLSL